MPCYRCGARQVDPVRGHSPWRRGVRDDQQVLICPDCQAATNWVADMGVRSQWAADLNGYDEVILSRVYREGDINRMHLLPEWKQIYADANGVVFVRRSAT